jgi:hypothetical protein
MPWNNITTDDLMSQFNAQERSVLANLQGGADSLAPILANTVLKVRGACVAGGSQVGPNGTVPDQLKIETIGLTLWFWLNSFVKIPALQTDGRKRNYTDAQAALAQVSRGEIKIEIPLNGTALSNPAPVNAAATVRRGRRVHERDYDGLSTT